MRTADAMRSGQVYGRTIEEVLEHAAAQPSRRIFWVNPTWPVIPAITNSGVALNFSKPANVNQLECSIREASAMGHSEGAFQRGTTEKYAERESIFVLNQKEKAVERVGEDPFGLQIAPTPYQKPARLLSRDIDLAAAKYPGLGRRRVADRACSS
ncbi:hypothetical protein GMDG_01463 [Pseudogymnoascus destructans 20631-21]|uniref:Uncharacterized protein n=1 Tax=Pseudogymnoascus destructans (strain ATCC MYA-4855 / 20631-21) TaxID=658429 RepID=L8FU18_PSED2|nr:hypothetical protein GMDG_01463 [Pseudogymnoascus destructans 20631-21]